MNLRDLQYLVALADHRHFGRAAAACFVSQPTLSTQVRKLEEELGVVLVARAPRKVMLTPAGEEMVARARRVLAEVEQMKEAARRTQDPAARTLRLGIIPTLGPFPLPTVMQLLHGRLPRLELQLLAEEKTPVLLERLQQGKLDAALLALPLHDVQLRVEPLFEEPFVLAVPAGHALAGAPAVDMADLADERLLLLEDGHCLRDQALDVCRLSGASEKTEFQATSLETLRQMVAAGVGITLLPTLAVKPPVARSDDIRLLSFEDADPPSRRIGMAWRRSSARAGILFQLAAAIRSLPAGLLAPPAPAVEQQAANG